MIEGHDLDGVLGRVTFATSAHLPPDGMARLDQNTWYVGWRTYAELLWVTDGRDAWKGRDRRRLKREHRKFVARRRPA